jgi:hypothetical protein
MGILICRNAATGGYEGLFQVGNDIFWGFKPNRNPV